MNFNPIHILTTTASKFLHSDKSSHKQQVNYSTTNKCKIKLTSITKTFKTKLTIKLTLNQSTKNKINNDINMNNQNNPHPNPFPPPNNSPKNPAH